MSVTRFTLPNVMRVKTGSLKTLLTILLAAIFVAHKGGVTTIAFEGGAPAGTVISNHAEATYKDEVGTVYSAVSPTVSVTIQAVASLAVTPDETTSSTTVAQRERITRLFRICNTGNVSDTYTVTAADVNSPATLVSLHFDNDATGTLTNPDTQITVNGAPSSQVTPGACLGVLAVVDTNDFPPGTNLTIRLTARSNSNGPNGRPSDDGTIINAVGANAVLTSPSDGNLPPLKTVNGGSKSVVTPGTPFTYTIAFRNSGDAPARNVVVTDNLKPEIEYVAGSLTLDGRNLTDVEDADEGSVQSRRVVIRLATVAPAQVVNITFTARLAAGIPAGVGVLNVAEITGQNVPPTSSSVAVVIIDPFGTVFAGRGGSAAPIPGARVVILLDQTDTSVLPIPPGAGFPPNVQNENPFATDALGHFSFALRPEQLGTETNPASYFIKVTAPAYSTRMLQITTQPTQAGLYKLVVHAIDGQPLARAGAFDLVNEDVTIEDIASVALNIPMFEPRGLEISKVADRPRAEIGDAIVYRVEVRNPTAGPVRDVVVRDRLPESFHYADGTGRLSVGTAIDQPIEPEIAGQEITFRVGEIGAGATARLLYRVRVGANAHEGEQENVAIGQGLFPNGEQNQTTPARASVFVGRGAFSTRQIILGRVFVDHNRNGKFDDGDMPLPGARLYLQSGQSVVTDSQGLYNLPSVGDGSQVVSLDPITLPTGYSLTDGGTLAGRSWTRLLRTPLGGGSMLRQNFALAPNENQKPADPSNTPTKETTEVADNLAASYEAAPARIAWKPQSGVSRYRIQLASDERFEDVIFDGAVTTSEYIATALAPGRYYWKVAAVQGKTGQYSQPTVFEVKSSTTQEFVATETFEPVAPGDIKVISPEANSVVMSPAMQLEARVALDWKVRLEVNGKAVSEKSIGTVRQDQKNKVTTYSYVGVGLRPGQNEVRVVAISPEGTAGRNQDLVVMGRGPAKRLEIITEKTQIQAGGRDSTVLKIRALDQWGNPAADDQVAIDTSSGQLWRGDQKPGANTETAQLNPATASGTKTLTGEPTANGGYGTGQVMVSLVQGEATIKLIGSGAPGEARLHAQTGQIEAETKVRITPESRPTILVGLAEMTVGQSLPEANIRDEQGHYRNRLSFFYSGRIGDRNLLTLSYDSQRPINRTAGRDRIFQLDPLDRVYPLFGDSSTRYEAAQSNSKLYARLDRDRSYAMFGDFEADMENLALAGYSRKLTGVKLHLENSQGDFISVTGARPDTAFARDAFPAGALALLRLSHSEILPGSETVVLEVRDRRNPERIIARETLSRSIDYNLNTLTGELFFLRYISEFDFNFNLTQLVVTYEHRANSLSSAVYTARARKNFAGLGLQLGFAGVLQKQGDAGSFVLGGLDGEKKLPNKGTLRFALARSQGEIMGFGNFFASGDSEHNGTAFLVELNQPIGLYQGVIRAGYSYSSEGFLNPFGPTVTPGTRRGEASIELKPRPSTLLRFGFTDERNHTQTVDNSRLTFSAVWEQMIKERVRLHLGYDHRSLEDASSTRTIESNLVTAAVDVKVTDKLQLSVKREQNLGEADPTYPDQTTLAATYQVNQWAKFFLTQRLASAAILPIADFSGSGSGFSSTGARRETALGIETRIGKYSSMIGRYQLENGINGTDSFAVIGLQNRLPISKKLALELGFERGFHMAGDGESYNSATLGFGWQPTNDFRASGRYEFRDRSGAGQVLALGAAGKLTEGLTALTRFQWSRTGFDGQHGSSIEGTAALAYRPLTSDRAGVLFSFTHRSLTQDGLTGSSATRDRMDSLATDGYFQATDRLELYGRLALRFNANGQADLPFVSTFTYLTQGRAQYRLTRRFDWAAEIRRLTQPSTGTNRSVYGTELGFWALPDLRIGLGYNFSATGEPSRVVALPARRGFYFTLSSKLSNLFDLFGTSNSGLSNPNGTGAVPAKQEKEGEKKK